MLAKAKDGTREETKDSGSIEVTQRHQGDSQIQPKDKVAFALALTKLSNDML